MAPATKPANAASHKTLSTSLRRATRSMHKDLNKFIVSRLPLALPPLAANPSLYASGLLHIAPIYVAFESLWQEIVNGPAGRAPATNTSLAGSQSLDLVLTPGPVEISSSTQPLSSQTRGINVSERVRTLLSDFRLPGFQRADALRRDLQRMTGWSAAEVDAQLRQVSSEGALRDFTDVIRNSIQERPHVLIAYGYVLHMALAARARFIRAPLEAAGDEFWAYKASWLGLTAASSQDQVDTPAVSPMSPVPPHGSTHKGSFLPDSSRSLSQLPLTFLHFDTPRDGEELKEEYKRRLLDAEFTLTSTEKDDITQEVVVIFDKMQAVLQQLDDLLTPPDTQIDALSIPEHTLRSERLRNSVVVTKERNERRAARSSEESYDCESGVSEPKIVPNTPKKSGRRSEDSTASKKSVRFVDQLPPSEKRKQAFTYDGQDEGDEAAEGYQDPRPRYQGDAVLRTVLLVLAYVAALIGFGLSAAIIITGYYMGRPGTPRAIARAAARAAAEAAAREAAGMGQLEL